jgi:hypothetical protein
VPIRSRSGRQRWYRAPDVDRAAVGIGFVHAMD